jgi:hypothetical protein
MIRRRRLRPSLLTAVIAVAVLGMPPAGAAAMTSGASLSAADGFGSAANSYSWSMAWFKGKLYVGTARNQLCVEHATVDFFYPGYYRSPPRGFPDVDCPPDPYDMDLRAEIWRFDPAAGTWTRVYQSPADIPNPRAPGKFVARDIGFRNMIVHRAPDGTESLYVAGVATNEYIPELAQSHPPRILRTTDGATFEALNGAPGVIETPFGSQRPMGYRAMASYDGRLFVTATGGLTGEGAIVEVERPWSDSPAFVQVSPETLAVFELETFDGSLYVGVGDLDRGYSVWKTDMRLPARFVPVVTDGAGRGKAISSVVSMKVFEGRLYVGASGWGEVYPSSELIRIDRHDRLAVVTGNARWTGGALRFPISGLPDGFGNLFNAHFWRQDTAGGALYVGTNDWSWGLRNFPVVNLLLRPEFGFDVFGTCDGVYWWRVTRDAFGAGLYNFGARTIVSTPAGRFIGSANHVEGTAVWRITDPSPCRSARSQASGAGTPSVEASAARPPQRLLTDVQSCGTVLSWEPSPGARRYRVMRSEYRVARDIPVARRPAPQGGWVPDVPVAPVRPGGASVDLRVAGRRTAIGTTARRFFVDRGARRGRRYEYQVVALSRSGRASAASNTATVPSARPRVTFAAASAALRRLDGADRARAARSLAVARRSWADAEPGRALARLARSAAAAGEAADAQDVVLRLARRLQHAKACGR